jgi:AmmeMemoRadiSam system protein B
MPEKSKLNNKIPALRTDIEFREIEEDGQEMVILLDRTGISPEPVAVSKQLLEIISNLDGSVTLNDLKKIFPAGEEGDIFLNIISDSLDYLDERFYLDNKRFHDKRDVFFREFLNNPVREPVCAGSSYPSEREECNNYLDEFFKSVPKENVSPGASSVIVPHIDFRLGKISHEVYAAGYHAIRDNDFDLAVIFGTSHYSNTSDFMLSIKNFETPLGITETDKEIVGKLDELCPGSFLIDELAHKDEHSIELQVVLLQHYFKGRKFWILPVLSGSLHHFMMNGAYPESNAEYHLFLDSLRKIIADSGRKAVFIASVDFAHIGRKFNDDFDAEPILPELEKEDMKLVNSLIAGNHKAFYDKIKSDGDKWKICGTAPIYSMQSLTGATNGKFLKYNQWNETEAASAVSFASIAYY